MEKVAKSLGDTQKDVELGAENNIIYDDSYNMSFPAPSNVMPPSSQAVKIASSINSRFFSQNKTKKKPT